MSIDRIATSTQTAYMTSQLLKAESEVSKYTEQVATGQLSTSYTDYDDQVQAMESARAVVNRTTAYQSATTLALTQVELQDTYLSQIDTLVSGLMETIGDAISSGDGSSLTDEVEYVMEEIAAILNAQDSSGNYIFGGGNNSTEPVTVDSLDDLAALTDVSDAFTNGSTIKSVQVSDTSTVDIGVLASDAGTDILSVLKDYADYITANGDFGTTLTTDQETFLSSFYSDISDAYSTVTTVEAQNGNVYSRLEEISDNQDALLTTYSDFLSDLQDVDMTEAATNLEMANTVLQAVVQVTATLNDVTLLNYLD